MIYTLPSGKYYIGDICYALSNENYEKCIDEYEYIINNIKVVIAWIGDDGEYIGTNKKIYGVDSGNIGMVHENLIDEKNKKYCEYYCHTFTSDITFNYDENNNIIYIKSDDYKLNIYIDDKNNDDDESKQELVINKIIETLQITTESLETLFKLYLNKY